MIQRHINDVTAQILFFLIVLSKIEQVPSKNVAEIKIMQYVWCATASAPDAIVAGPTYECRPSQRMIFTQVNWINPHPSIKSASVSIAIKPNEIKWTTFDRTAGNVAFINTEVHNLCRSPCANDSNRLFFIGTTIISSLSKSVNPIDRVIKGTIINKFIVEPIPGMKGTAEKELKNTNCENDTQATTL